MIIFLYGEDSYRIGQKLNELASAYRSKNQSGLNLVNLNLAEDNIENLAENLKSDSLILEKKLVLLKNVFGADEERTLDLLKKNKIAEREDTILIATSFKTPSGKSNLFQFLIKKPNRVSKYSPLGGSELKNWVRDFAGALGVVLAGETMDFLILNCGSDLWRLSGEIRKLADYKIKGVLNKTEAEKLINADLTAGVFDLSDALGRKDKKAAVEALFKVLDNGEAPAEIIGLLAWQARNLLRFKSSPERAFDLNLHPFVLQKVRAAARMHSPEELVKFLKGLINLDLALKTGKTDAKTALTLLIAEI